MGFAKIRADGSYLQLFFRYCASYRADVFQFYFLLLSSSSVFQSSSFPGGRNTNSRTSASPVRCMLSPYHKTVELSC